MFDVGNCPLFHFYISYIMLLPLLKTYGSVYGFQNSYY